MILIFELNLNISGSLAYDVILWLFNEKKSRLGIKSEAQFLKKKQ
jgi:hypothetical protein